MIGMEEKELLQEQHEMEFAQFATQLIQEMGIPARLKGYLYLRTAIVMTALHPEMQCGQIYNMVADKYNTKPRSMEFTIRYAIDKAYDVNPKQLQSCFPYSVEKPSNWDVIALTADRVRMRG